mmetsp:Transcript_25773/g.70846  ORF Transcript_25773/g.70846 Transcript_25773/m.70846 type:complete len:91 (-) Transcript_25773:135-407(-)
MHVANLLTLCHTRDDCWKTRFLRKPICDRKLLHELLPVSNLPTLSSFDMGSYKSNEVDADSRYCGMQHRSSQSLKFVIVLWAQSGCSSFE